MTDCVAVLTGALKRLGLRKKKDDPSRSGLAAEA